MRGFLLRVCFRRVLGGLRHLLLGSLGHTSEEAPMASLVSVSWDLL